MCPAHLTVWDLIALITFTKKYKLWSSLLYNFQQPQNAATGKYITKSHIAKITKTESQQHYCLLVQGATVGNLYKKIFPQWGTWEFLGDEDSSHGFLGRDTM
jgi:hypothetical protein